MVFLTLIAAVVYTASEDGSEHTKLGMVKTIDVRPEAEGAQFLHMEHLWSPGVADGRNPSRIPAASHPRNTCKPLPPTVTVGREDNMVRRGSTVRVC
jgi:hypothetical protein